MKSHNFLFIAAIALCSIIICEASIASVQQRASPYLPQDQGMQVRSVQWTVKPTLTEQVCEASTDALGEGDQALACVALRLDCPDCCLDWNEDPDIRPIIKSVPPITEGFPYYNQSQILFQSIDGSGSTVCPSVRDCTKERTAFATTNCTVSDWHNPASNLDIAHCQERGCPATKIGPDGSVYIYAEPYLSNPWSLTNPSGTRCVPDGIDYSRWYCNKYDEKLVPLFTGCNALATSNYMCNITKTGNSHVVGLMPAYQRTKNQSCPWEGTGKNCTLYELNPTVGAVDSNTSVLGCVENCINNARGFERYERDIDCFLNGDGVCSDVDGAIYGFMNNCNVYQCQQRIDWKRCIEAPDGTASVDLALYGGPEDLLCCDNIDPTTDQVQKYYDEANSCLNPDTREGGGCFSCFQPLNNIASTPRDGRGLWSEFNAKSNQEIAVFWQLQIIPEYCWTGLTACPSGSQNAGLVPSAYIYTMIKIFDVTDGQEKEVFPGDSGQGIPIQTPFLGASSVLGAVMVGKKDNGNSYFLTEGHRYRVKIYWYIPSVSNVILSAKVNSGQIMIIKTRK